MNPIRITVPARLWPAPQRVSVAITLFPFVFTKKGWENDPGLKAHEEYHFQEMLRWGVIPWYIRYISLMPKYGGGRRHPMEIPAYELQDRINKEKEE